MNIHIYTTIATSLFYLILLQFKKDIQGGSNKNLIYVLFVPFVIYAYYYLFYNNELSPEVSIYSSSILDKSSDLLTSAYPLSSDL